MVKSRIGSTMNVAHHRSYRIWFGAVGLAVSVALFGLIKGCSVDEAGLLRSANQALAKNQYQQALQLASKVLSQSPQSAPALLIAGEAAAMSGRTGEAADYYSSIPDDGSPEGVSALFEAGEMLRELGYLSLAERSYRRVLEHDPEHTPAHANLAFLLGSTGRRVESNEHLLQLLHQRNASLFALRMLGDVDVPFEAESYITKCRAATPDDPLLLLGQAITKLLANDPQAARPMLRKIVAALPRQMDAQAALGQALLATNALDAFLEWHAQLPPEAERHPGVWTARGQWAWENEQPRAAIRCYWEAFLLAPHSRAPNHMLGRILDSLDQHNFAKPFLQRTKRLHELSHVVRSDAFEKDLSNFQQAARLTESMGRIEEALAWAHAALRVNRRLKWAQETIDRVEPKLNADAPQSAAGAIPIQDFDLSTYPLPQWPERGSSSVALTNGADRKWASSAQLSFRDVAAAAGIEFTYFQSPNPTSVGQRIFESTGGGVGVLDFDGDGWPDLYFTQGCQWPPKKGQRVYRDRLYRNLGNGKFADVSVGSGVGDERYSQGVSVGDYNNDGFADLYVANIGANRLYRNNGDGTFSDVTSEVGIEGNLWTTSCLIADLNGDTWPDIYDVNYLKGNDVFTKYCERFGVRFMCAPKHFEAARDQLYLSRGDGTFEEFSPTSDFRLPAGPGLGIVAADFNRNGRLDLFVANDNAANFYFVNRSQGPLNRLVFSEQGLPSGLAFGEDGFVQGCMGVAAFDPNGDGLLDLFVTNFVVESNELYLQQTGGYFRHGARQAGLRTPSYHLVGWGTQAIDGELDGLPDLVVANGDAGDYTRAGRTYQQPPQYFQNVGRGKFLEVPAKQLGPYFQKKLLGRGLARLDWNRDGREDFAVSHLFSPVALLTNQTENVGHFLAVRLRGVNSNRDAIGTILKLKAGPRTWVSQLTAGDGYLASNQRQVVFGLGALKHIDELQIRWPSGLEQTFVDLPTDRELLFVEGRSGWYSLPH